MAYLERFADMFAVQRATQEARGDLLLSEAERIQRINNLTLLAGVEAGDMLTHLGLKSHHPFREVDWGNALHEYVDELKYVLAKGVVAGFTAEDIIRVFFDKSEAVNAQLLRDQLDISAQPVVVFDLDGVLCQYQSLTDDEIADGAFRDAEPNAMLCGFTNTLHSWGVKVVIVTSRKTYRWRNVATDTELWLRANRVHCDRLIFSYDKAYAVSGLSVALAIEDSPKHALAYADAGIPTAYMRSSHNVDSPAPEHENITACETMGDFFKRISQLFRESREDAQQEVEDDR